VCVSRGNKYVLEYPLQDLLRMIQIWLSVGGHNFDARVQEEVKVASPRLQVLPTGWIHNTLSSPIQRRIEAHSYEQMRTRMTPPPPPAHPTYRQFSFFFHKFYLN
jgi:hypothetical protein